ncbi:MAG TPA: hypothetical protein VNO35_30365 [Steroidobacteraceae bacterium]|nr:hypothetical protein [Steroidobacteraceae bacterium]
MAKSNLGLRFARVALVVTAGTLVSMAAAEAGDARLAFEVREGLNINSLVREGDVAAHVVLRSGAEPRILITFPAGNSAVGLWFDHLQRPAQWTQRGVPQPIHETDEKGRPLRGVATDLIVTAAELRVRAAVLSSTRVLRDFQALNTTPAEVAAPLRIAGRTLIWSRDRLDGAPGYRLSVEVTQGQLESGRIAAAADGRIGLHVVGLTGEPPLVPLTEPQLLSAAAGTDVAARHTLEFLAYREKFLAGSWRFDTYFGRDTLLSVRLLMPALTPAAIEAGMASVLTRLSAQGEVAHEEDIGERAILDHLQSDGSRSAAPVFDYKMIDSSYLLAPVAVAWLLDDERGRTSAAAFLAAAIGTEGGRSGSRGAALVTNLRLVLESAGPFANDPQKLHLISLKPGVAVGEWRDSEVGLGGGRYPYDVNAVLVPAALDAAARLYGSGLLTPYLRSADRELFGRAAKMAERWSTNAPPLFEVSIAHETAAHAVEAYAEAQHIDPHPALASLGQEPLQFHALALDSSGKALPVMHSDEGFALLFAKPDAGHLDLAITSSLRLFPAGLMTDVGMLVANPAFCAPALQSVFSRNAYHGAVVWSWQQALFAAGLERQLHRRDLSPEMRSHLQQAQRTLWKAIAATQAQRNSELWSWNFTSGHYEVAAFGAAAADADESNAAQLWSTVYLAVRPPTSSKNTGQ